MLTITLLVLPVSAKTLRVGNDQTYKMLAAALSDVKPADTILLYTGVYKGGSIIHHLNGLPGQPITIMGRQGDSVILRGGSEGLMLRSVAYLSIEHILFEQQTSNGCNADDGGVVHEPSHHLVFSKCVFRNIAGTGNNDLLKLSGLDSFAIRDCIFLNGAKGGSGIDMVGCHYGVINNCRFENMGSNAIQAKGGSQFIRIERNFFNHCGERTLNLGGSTGLAFFRPVDATFEAADLQVYANVIIGSDAPVAYVGCVRVSVVNNTIYQPERWVVRILQENNNPSRFIPCSNNEFRNNIICHGSKVKTDCNIGAGTDGGSFQFSNNYWFHLQDAGWKGPVGLPVADADAITGSDPLFTNISIHNFTIPFNSPVAGKGYESRFPEKDYSGNLFKSPRSIGAFELRD